MLAKLLPGLLSAIVFGVSGTALWHLCSAGRRHFFVEGAGFGFLLGVAWIAGGAYAAADLFGAPVALPTFVVLALLAAVGGAIGVRRRRRSASPAERRSRPGWPALVLLLVTVAVTVALLADATRDPVVDFDGRMSWGVAAKHVAASASVLPPAWTDSRAFVVNPRYPLLMPIARVAQAQLAGTGFDGFAIRPLYVLFLPALVGVAYAGLRRHAGELASALALLLLVAQPFRSWNLEGGARGTYSDLPLAAFAGAALLLLLDRQLRAGPALAAGLLLAGAVMTKSEGAFVAAFVLLAAAYFHLRSARFRRLGWSSAAPLIGAALPALMAGAIVMTWSMQVPARNQAAYLGRISTLGDVEAWWARAPAVSELLVQRSFDTAAWGYLPYLAPLLVLAGWRGLRHRAARAACIALLGVLAAPLLAYSVTDRLDIVEATWNRFLIQATVPLALLTAMLVRELRTALPGRLGPGTPRGRNA